MPLAMVLGSCVFSARGVCAGGGVWQTHGTFWSVVLKYNQWWTTEWCGFYFVSGCVEELYKDVCVNLPVSLTTPLVFFTGEGCWSPELPSKQQYQLHYYVSSQLSPYYCQKPERKAGNKMVYLYPVNKKCWWAGKNCLPCWPEWCHHTLTGWWSKLHKQAWWTQLIVPEILGGRFLCVPVVCVSSLWRWSPLYLVNRSNFTVILTPQQSWNVTIGETLTNSEQMAKI